MRGRVGGKDDLIAQVGAGEAVGIDLKEEGMHEDLGDTAAVFFEDLDDLGFERCYFGLGDLKHCLIALQWLSYSMWSTTTFPIVNSLIVAGCNRWTGT
jgi:hypothetical protein